MANLEVDPSQLLKDGDEFSNMAGKAENIRLSFRQGNEGITFPADDPVSQEFTKQWDDLVRGVDTLLASFRDAMYKTAGDIGNTAALYAASNLVNTESVPLPPRIGRGPTVRG